MSKYPKAKEFIVCLQELTNTEEQIKNFTVLDFGQNSFCDFWRS